MRPRLPDAAARKQLATLLLLRLKLPGEHGTVAKEVVSLVAETQDSQQLQEAFGTMEEPDIVTLLSSLDETAVNQLHTAMLPCDNTCKRLVDKELARRLASRLSLVAETQDTQQLKKASAKREGPDIKMLLSSLGLEETKRLIDQELARRRALQLNEERVKRLWQLLQGHVDSEQDSWAQAAACLLSVHAARMEVHLGNLSSKVLTDAAKFLDDQDLAIAFAKDFFACDLGISSAKQWPLKSSAPVISRRRSFNCSSRAMILPSQILSSGHPCTSCFMPAC